MASGDLSLDELAALFDDVQSSQSEARREEAADLTMEEAGVLLSKLMSAGLLRGVALLDGGAFATMAQLEAEAFAAIDECRTVEIARLARLLDVEESAVQRIFAERLARDSQPPPAYVDRVSYVSVRRLDDIVEQCLSQLHAASVVYLPKLAQQCSVSLDLLVAHLDRCLHADSSTPTVDALQRCLFDRDAQLLYDERFVERCRHQLLGRFRAVSRPAFVAELLSGLPGNDQLKLRLLEELLLDADTKPPPPTTAGAPLDADTKPPPTTTAGALRRFGHVLGRVSDARAVYEPVVFARRRDADVAAAFSTEHCIDYGWLWRAYRVRDAAALCQQLLSPLDPQLLCLERCAVGTAVQSQIEAAVVDCLAANAVCNLTTVVPAACSGGDLRALVARVLASMKTAHTDVVLLSRWLVPRRQLAQLVASFDGSLERAFLQQFAATPERPEFRQQSIIQTGRGAVTRSSENVRAGGSRKTKLRTRSKRQLADSLGSPCHDASSSSSTAQASADSADATLPLTDADLCEHIAARLPDVPPALVADHVRPQLLDRAAVVVARLRTKLDQREQLGAKFETSYVSALLFWQQAQRFGDEAGVLADYHAKTTCAQVLRTIVDFQALDCPSSSAPSSQSSPFAIVASFPADVRHFVQLLIDALQRNDPEQFFAVVQQQMPVDMHLKQPSFDAYTERSLISQHTHTIAEQLRSVDDGPRFLQLFLSYLLTTRCGILLHAPGRWMPKMLQRLQPHISQRAYDKLSQFHQWSLAVLTKKADADLLAKVADLVRELRAVVKNAHDPDYGRVLTDPHDADQQPFNHNDNDNDDDDDDDYDSLSD